MKIILLIFFLFWGYTSQAQKKVHTIKAQLLAPVKTRMHCGVLSFTELLVFSEPELKGNDTVGLYLLCPADYDTNFLLPGKMYEIRYIQDTSMIKGVIKRPASLLKDQYILGSIKDISASAQADSHRNKAV